MLPSFSFTEATTILDTEVKVTRYNLSVSYLELDDRTFSLSLVDSGLATVLPYIQLYHGTGPGPGPGG